MGLTIALALVLDLSGALHVYHLSRFQGQRFAAAAALVLIGIAAGWVMLALLPPVRPQNNEQTARKKNGKTDLGAQASRLPAGRMDTLPTPCLLSSVPWLRSLSFNNLLSMSPQIFITLLMLAAWLATWHDFERFLLAESAMGLPVLLLFGGGAVALAVATVRPPDPGWLLGGVAIGGSVVRLLGYASVPIDPTRADMLPLVQGALDNFLSGHAPYTLYHMPWELPLTYLPVTWLAYLPPHVLDLDLRWTNLAAELVVGGALVLLAMGENQLPDRERAGWRGNVGLLLWGWVFLQPTVQHWSQVTTTPVLWALLCLLLVLVRRGQNTLAAGVLGLGIAASPMVAVGTPFVALVWLRARGWKGAAVLVGIAAGIAGAIMLPFVLWSPQQFFLGCWQWFNDNTMFPLLKWEMEKTWGFMVGLSGLFWRFDLVALLKPIQATLIVVLLGIFWWGNRGARQLAPMVAAAFLLFLVFNPVLWPYLYNTALVAALVAVVEEEVRRSE